MVIVGLTCFLCVHVHLRHLIHFFTIDPSGSKLTCYLFLYVSLESFGICLFYKCMIDISPFTGKISINRVVEILQNGP